MTASSSDEFPDRVCDERRSQDTVDRRSLPRIGGAVMSRNSAELTEPAGGTLTRLARNNSATRRAVDADESCPRVVAKHARSIDSRFLDDSARDDNGRRIP